MKTLSRQALDYETLEYVFCLLQSGRPLPYRVKRNRIVFHLTGAHRQLFRTPKRR